MRTKIIYEDKDLLVVYKPAGLATETKNVGEQDLESEIKNYLGSSYLGTVLRLDQPVEGLILLCKTKQASGQFTKQLFLGGLEKKYLAMVCGEVEERQAELVDYMYKTKGNRVEILPAKDRKVQNVKASDQVETIMDKATKKAVLRYQVRKKIPCTLRNDSGIAVDIPIYLLDVEIDTGRLHQIRAQLSHAGLPLLGDVKYGSELSKMVSKELGIKNVALCADRLSFWHPTNQERKSFEIKPENPAFQLAEK
ncbi:MAG: hypothetical protein IJ794_14940 [Lachnospiraceae bacterium]|nr:hypothetical protein [Lachnospiraceae bacterium]